jgi:hypothetical protein
MKITVTHSIYGPSEHDSILGALAAERIFGIEKTEAGFKFTERCDEYFSLNLSREQLLALADEIRALAS